MYTCKPCDMYGGMAQCAEYRAPSLELWTKHKGSCPTQIELTRKEKL